MIVKRTFVHSVFQDRLRSLRESHGYTQETMSEKLAVSLRTYSYWENGKRKPDIEELYNLCDVLDCDPNYLLGNINAPYDNRKVEEATGLEYESVEELKKLSDTQLYILNRLFNNYSLPQMLYDIEEFAASSMCEVQIIDARLDRPKTVIPYTSQRMMKYSAVERFSQMLDILYEDKLLSQKASEAFYERVKKHLDIQEENRKHLVKDTLMDTPIDIEWRD